MPPRLLQRAVARVVLVEWILVIAAHEGGPPGVVQILAGSSSSAWACSGSTT